MEAPLFAAHLGFGSWQGTQYELEMCPICGKTPVVFDPDGKWTCKGCNEHKSDLFKFKTILAGTDDVGKQLADGILMERQPEGLIVVSEFKSSIKSTRIGTGFSRLDMMTGGLGDSSLTVLTGKRGEGKSTFAGQLALNAIENGHKVCFYSGELSALMFQTWIFSQAAGDSHMINMQDQFGNDFWIVDDYIEGRIRTWLGKSFILYDNTVTRHSERNAILERFKIARRVYGCDLFFIDNLMTAKYSIDAERDYWRAQSNFAGELKDFAQENKVHVILVAHPKKGDSGDINDDVSGSADITNRADNVIQVKKPNDAERAELNADSIITVSKNRDFGRVGRIRYSFSSASRRLSEIDGRNIDNYGWKDLC